MLGSLTPLGERSRGHRWFVTVLLFGVASTCAGGLVGSALATLGLLLGMSPRVPWVSPVIGAAAIAGFLIDTGRLRLHLPSPHRQVNDAWLPTYRRWVYAIGFGGQLGVGFATVVNGSALYVVSAAAFASGAVWRGAAMLGAYGAIRAASLLATRGVRDSAALYALLRRAESARAKTYRMLSGMQALAAAALVIVIFVA
jgi:hypothetical protein